MNPESTLEAVRELSENATLRPPPKHLRLARAKDVSAGLRRATVAYEDAHTPKIGSWNRPHQQAKPRKVSKRLGATYSPERDNDFLNRALKKTRGEAA